MNKLATPKIVVKLVTVTPDMAIEMLEKNNMNRNIDQKRVDQYAQDMKAGRWVLNGTTIVFADDGTLLDGQHRLWAIVEANVPIQLLIVYNADKDSIVTMDIGKVRTASNIMQIERSAHSVTAATMTKLLWLHDFVDSNLSPATCRMDVNNNDLREFYNERKDMIEQAATVAERVHHPFVKSHMALAFCIIGRSTAHRDKLKSFFDTLKTGSNIDMRHPIMTLRNRLLDNRLKVRVLSVQETLAAYIRVWNAYVRGKDLTVIRWNATEPMPEVI